MAKATITKAKIHPMATTNYLREQAVKSLADKLSSSKLMRERKALSEAISKLQSLQSRMGHTKALRLQYASDNYDEIVEAVERIESLERTMCERVMR